MPAKKSTRKVTVKAPSISAPITVDAGDWRADAAPIGAHVSIAGGTWEAAARAREISATGAQIFTKQANRWVEREIDTEEVERFRAGMAETSVRWICAHDSYLINLASPDPVLRARSIESFRAELRRCHALGLDALVSHPGNFMDDRASGLARNADGIIEALEAESGSTRLLMELTAGQGTVLGSTFPEMAALLDRIPAALRSRVGVCLDTAHVWAAGYDLVTRYDEVWQQFADALGFERLGCLHLNDSKAALGSHLDRHDLIGEGTIGADVFHRIMTDSRLTLVPKILETPKGDTPADNDGRMLRLLRSFAGGAVSALALCTAALTASLTPRTAPAQASPETPVWSAVQEAAGVIGSRWLDGARTPRVSSAVGGMIGLGVMKPVSPTVRTGVMLRAGVHPLDVQEQGTQWDGGTLREIDLLATVSVDAFTRRRMEFQWDALGGAAVFGGASGIPPFREIGLLSPMGEIGLRATRQSRDGQFVPRRTFVYARVGAVRLNASTVQAIVSSGWVPRVVLGVRSAR